MKKARIQTLKAEFESLSMIESDQLDEFYMKLNALVTNIRPPRGNNGGVIRGKKIALSSSSKILTDHVNNGAVWKFREHVD